MLSYILRLAFNFERKHGFWPNQLTLNNEQYQHWLAEFEQTSDFNELSRRLSMEITISSDARHPHVGWHPNQALKMVNV